MARAPRARAPKPKSMQDVLEQHRDILDQLEVCHQIVTDMHRSELLPPAQRKEVLQAVGSWYVRLARASAMAQAELPELAAEPDPRQRALAFWPIVSHRVDDLDETPSLNVKKFLIHVAWHEGDKLQARTQYGGGPGRSFFQFEAYRAKEAVQYAVRAH